MQLGSSCQCALMTLIIPGQVELYNSKIYDEELVDQQLGDRIKALQEQLGKVRSSDGSGAVELKLLAMVQSRSHQAAFPPPNIGLEDLLKQ